MQTKLTGVFLVNGIKCHVSIDKDSIHWLPVRGSSGKQEDKNTNEKSVKIANVVGTKCKYSGKQNSERKIATASSSDSKNDCSSTISKRTCNKFKVYYSRSDYNNASGRLLKLKKLSFCPIKKNPTTSSLSSSSSSSASISSSTSNRSSECQQDSSAQTKPIDCNTKEATVTSGPSSCYVSESGSDQLSIASMNDCSNTISREDRVHVEAKDLIESREQNCDNEFNTNSTSQSGTTSTVTSAIQTHTTTHHNEADKQCQQFEELIQRIETKLEFERKKRPQRLLVFVNPFGGKGRASHLYKKQVRSLFELAKVEAKLVITKYANHARDTMEDPQFNVEYFDGIICVGGDGMFSELMNGLLYRYNREKILTTKDLDKDDTQTISTSNQEGNKNDTTAQKLTNLRSALGGIGEQFISPIIPIGVIGAGSTDATSFGLIGTNDVITGTLNIILGNLIDVDVCSIHTLNEDRLLRFVSTFVAYGYFGDVIRESEKLRWLGPSRYDVTGVNNLIKNRTYKGQINIYCSPHDGSPFNMEERCHKDCKLCQANFNEQKNLEDLELELIEREGSFIGVNAAVTACRCPQTKKGFSPTNHLANGCADLILVRPCSRLDYIKYLLRTGWTKKSPFDLKYVEAYRCRQFEFVALEQNSSQSFSSSSTSSVDQSSCHSGSLDIKRSSSSSLTDGSFSSWNVDGEVLEEQSIRVKVNNQLLRVFGTGEPQLQGKQHKNKRPLKQ